MRSGQAGKTPAAIILVIRAFIAMAPNPVRPCLAIRPSLLLVKGVGRNSTPSPASIMGREEEADC